MRASSKKDLIGAKYENLSKNLYGSKNLFNDLVKENQETANELLHFKCPEDLKWYNHLVDELCEENYAVNKGVF